MCTFRGEDKEGAGNMAEKSVPFRIVPAIVPMPPNGGAGINLTIAPHFGAPGPIQLWSFLERPLEGYYDENGHLVIEPVRYVKDEPIGISFRFADALGNLLVYDTGNVWVDVARIVPSGFIEEYELVAVYEIPYDPGEERYAAAIPYGEQDDWWAVTPGLYKLSLTIKAVWLESLVIETIWIEVAQPGA